MASVEVLFLDDIGSYRKHQVATLEEGSLLFALVRGNKVEILNPPDWTLEAALTPKSPEEIKDTASALKRALKPTVKEVPVTLPIGGLGSDPYIVEGFVEDSPIKLPARDVVPEDNSDN